MPDEFPQRISFSPDPPRAGESCTICYDFIGSGITSTVLDIEFNPTSGSGSYPVSAATPCVTITIPTTADSIEVFDQSDKSSPNARMIQHPQPGGG